MSEKHHRTGNVCDVAWCDKPATGVMLTRWAYNPGRQGVSTRALCDSCGTDHARHEEGSRHTVATWFPFPEYDPERDEIVR